MWVIQIQFQSSFRASIGQYPDNFRAISEQFPSSFKASSNKIYSLAISEQFTSLSRAVSREREWTEPLRDNLKGKKRKKKKRHVAYFNIRLISQSKNQQKKREVKATWMTATTTIETSVGSVSSVSTSQCVSSSTSAASDKHQDAFWCFSSHFSLSFKNSFQATCYDNNQPQPPLT